MFMYTNSGLVRHAKKALKLKTKYMWGGILRSITKTYVQQVSSIPGYKSQYPQSRINILNSVVGKGYYGVDCVGLIKSYYWSGNSSGGTGSKDYKASTDVNAHTMFANAKVKGKIDTLPEVPGLVLYCKTYPHVGVYIGNGEVIESTLSSRGDGVVQTKLTDFKWEYWMECPYITYSNTHTVYKTTQRTLMFGAALRAGPTPESEKITVIKPDTNVLMYIGSEKEYKGPDKRTYIYVRVKYNQSIGWIVKSSLKE